MISITRMISNYNHYNGNSVKYITIHGTGSAAGTDTALNNGKYFSVHRGASAHYFVDDNNIVQVVEDHNGSWHCGDGGNAYGINNQNSIGIEMCCTNFTHSDKTVQNTIDLVKHLQAKYNIPNERVIRHYDASRKTCPSYWVDNAWHLWNVFKQTLSGAVDTPPLVDNGKPPVVEVGNYLNLKPHMTKWNVYPMNAKPVTGNQCGALNPNMFAGLSYKIIEDRGDVKVINTGDFGTVQIYAPRDNDSTITTSPVYGNVAPTPPTITTPSNKKFLNLHPHISSWRVYPTNASPTIGNECGSLAPSYYGGLSYEILEDRGDIKIINTSTFGRVQIFAPRDADSSITGNPIY